MLILHPHLLLAHLLQQFLRVLLAQDLCLGGDGRMRTWLKLNWSTGVFNKRNLILGKHLNIILLVGGFEKYEFVSWDHYSQYMDK